ncbi:MAG: LemA family protein [Synergistaceae bacterium]|jgi:LemA protein|nr:LemA family protein [Synergistaceae bacterium]
MSIAFSIVIGIVVLAVVCAIGAFNALVRGRNQSKEAWSDVETHLKRRYDLIPNLVETVKGYARHESETLEKVVAARNAAMNQTGAESGDMEKHAAAENQLTRSLKSIFALSESYPDLKANQNFLELQRELTDTEDKIQASRRFFNSMVLSFNNRVETFPSMLIAGMFHFEKLAFFELDESERAEVSRPVRVQF